MPRFFVNASLAWAIAALLATSGLAKPIHYLAPESDDDPRGQYPVALLRLALQKDSQPFELAPATTTMQQGRAVAELTRNSGLVDVIFSMTSIEREAQLLPVRIPIDRGLLGWRLALIPEEDANLFSAINSSKDLAVYIAGQGHDWPDTAILRANGLSVEAVSTYPALFKMLAARRIHYFPRSLIEIQDEAAAHSADGIIIDEHIVLHYPTAEYFFVSQANPQLAERIRKGLELCIADGSFDQLFYSRFGKIIEAARLDKRHVIELRNPLLPPATPLERKEFWFQAGQAPR